MAHGVYPHTAFTWPFHWIWKLEIMPKIKIFLWQLCHNALPVRGTLLQRGINIDPSCPLCLSNIESIEHLFKDCLVASQVWEATLTHRWIPSNISPSRYDSLHHCLGYIRLGPGPLLRQRFSFLLWSLWKARNATVFNNDFFNLLHCLIQAKKASAEWRIRTRTSVDIIHKGTFSPFLLPPI